MSSNYDWNVTHDEYNRLKIYEPTYTLSIFLITITEKTYVIPQSNAYTDLNDSLAANKVNLLQL